MRILGTDVVAQSSRPMSITEAKLLDGGTVGAESIGDDPLRLDRKRPLKATLAVQPAWFHG